MVLLWQLQQSDRTRDRRRVVTGTGEMCNVTSRFYTRIQRNEARSELVKRRPYIHLSAHAAQNDTFCSDEPEQKRKS
jgi:hypothetical protein